MNADKTPYHQHTPYECYATLKTNSVIRFLLATRPNRRVLIILCSRGHVIELSFFSSHLQSNIECEGWPKYEKVKGSLIV